MAAILTPANKGMSPTNDNEDMAEAVQKLSTMLREQEDPDLQDVELINRISQQISRMMDHDDDDDDNYNDYDGDDMYDDKEYNGQQLSRRGEQPT